MAPMNDPDARSGRTSRLMAAAPPNAIFVAPSAANLPYFRHLASHLGRRDLTFQGPAFLALAGQPYRAHAPATVVVDHATWNAIPASDAVAAARWWLDGARADP